MNVVTEDQVLHQSSVSRASRSFTIISRTVVVKLTARYEMNFSRKLHKLETYKSI